MKKFLAIAVMSATLLSSALVRSAANASNPEGGMIDPGGISTSRAVEEQFVAQAAAKKYQDQQRQYWLGVAGLIVFSLGIFEIGLRLGRKQVR